MSQIKMIIKSDFRYSVKFLIAFVVMFSAIFSENVNAQISAEKASYRTLTEYASSANDSIFVFCDPGDIKVGELKASSPDGTNGWTFEWTKWDINTSDFTMPITTETNQTESFLTMREDGLYRVVISKSGESDVSDQAWVLNNVNTSILNLDKLDCIGVNFTASFLPVNLQYTNIDNVPNKKNVISNLVDGGVELKFSLIRDNQELLTAGEVLNTLPFNNVNKSFIDEEANEVDKTYQLLVTDQYGCDFTSKPIVSKTYKVKADFSVVPEKGEAPLEVKFTNNSINATEYEWYLYQDVERVPEEATKDEDRLLTDGILLADDKDPFDFTYEHPGKYLVKLIVKSDKGPEVCKDSLTLSTPIVVDTSLVQVPNVFTPNGDGRNDVWRIKSQSLESFHAIVFNRWGRVVYEWRNPEEGWNGKVNGKMATPGTYFYVITAVGREEKTKKYTKKGSFMLIRK